MAIAATFLVRTEFAAVEEEQQLVAVGLCSAC
jgi:hypothetical protein